MLRLVIFLLVAATAVTQAGILDDATAVKNAISFFSNKGFNVNQLIPKEENVGF